MKPLHVQHPGDHALRIMLITSNAVMRMGMHATLSAHPSITVIDGVSVGADAVKIISRENPKVILLDLELSDTDPLMLIKELRAAASGSHILVLSGLNDGKLTLKALAAGAEGVVLNIQPPAVLLAAIESMGGAVLSVTPDRPARSVNGSIRALSSPGDNDPTRLGFIESLTTREREVIQLVAKGLKNRDIADRLCLSETTIRHHLTAIFSKLQVSTRQQLLIMAHRQGLVELGAER
jgi:DNA-binding NarL/FixJ family response regulator